MITRADIDKLSALSRLKLTEDEAVRMQGDMTSILAYVDKLKAAVGTETGPIMSANKNVMREDADPHQSGEFTDRLVALAPRRETTKEGSFVKVKKILGGSQ
ncbi:MAG TPA: Asp-tRNA(Asn)/Glu-tRNA(Gln) amidotransferase subunit GatC [Candidatus Paceibacterota bacterium]|nr:Asp-tRNA(Asn)/Glu-tRNA(Gln) amidotransferase subunit GatC [Candidatus Paceibacterota bacterium]